YRDRALARYNPRMLPDGRRYQIFVSSTYRDLMEERRYVMQALLEMDCIPAGMELFPASNENQWTMIRTEIDKSDYYVVILAGRYGSTDQTGLSYTEKEYDYAVETGKPVIGLLYKDPHSLPKEKRDTDPESLRRLLEFHKKAKDRMVAFWSTPD